jgi:hypothetical protein
MSIITPQLNQLEQLIQLHAHWYEMYVVTTKHSWLIESNFQITLSHNYYDLKYNILIEFKTDDFFRSVKNYSVLLDYLYDCSLRLTILSSNDTMRPLNLGYLNFEKAILGYNVGLLFTTNEEALLDYNLIFGDFKWIQPYMPESSCN